MTKHKAPKIKSIFSIVFLIPKNYFNGVKLFMTALVQPLHINLYVSSQKISFLPQVNTQQILSNHTNKL